MAKGISIHVGVNQIESKTFEAERLQGCEEDAISMFEIAMGLGFMPGWRSPSGEPAPMLGRDATYDNVTEAIESAANALEPGDIFLFTFAGHGIQSVDPDAEGDQDDLLDESIVLVDHMLLDNYWKSHLWPQFKGGVRAVAVADCCHSATVFLESAPEGGFELRTTAAVGGFGGPDPLSMTHALDDRRFGPQALPFVARQVSPLERDKELKAFPTLYNEQLKTTSNTIAARRLLLSACDDSEKAADGQHHGAFTQALLDVWDGGEFHGSYAQLMLDIGGRFGPRASQHPVLTEPTDQLTFRTQRPFSI